MRNATTARGFTLIELLVVTGIIALLISILLPSLNSARKQARLVQCQSNLRQIGQAITLYTSDNKLTFPPGLNFDYDWAFPTRYQHWDNPVTSPRNLAAHPDWFPTADKIIYPWSGDATRTVYLQQFLGRIFPDNMDAPSAGTPYTQNKIYRCPELTEDNVPEAWLASPGSGHYRYNVLFAAGRRTSAMQRSTEAMLMYDICWPDWRPSQYPHMGPTAAKVRLNALYGDGHVDTVTYRDLLSKFGWRPGVFEGDSKFYSGGWRTADR